MRRQVKGCCCSLTSLALLDKVGAAAAADVHLQWSEQLTGLYGVGRQAAPAAGVKMSNCDAQQHRIAFTTCVVQKQLIKFYRTIAASLPDPVLQQVSEMHVAVL